MGDGALRAGRWAALRARLGGRRLVSEALLALALAGGLEAGMGLAGIEIGMALAGDDDGDGPPWRDHHATPAAPVALAGASTTPLRPA